MLLHKSLCVFVCVCVCVCFCVCVLAGQRRHLLPGMQGGGWVGGSADAEFCWSNAAPVLQEASVHVCTDMYVCMLTVLACDVGAC